MYGAAEFSRDTDLVILADAGNLVRLRRALADLQAEVIAVPPFQAKHLRRGHAIHFRCRHPDLSRMRIDVMSRLRGVGSFAALWRRRATIALPDGFSFDVMSLPDLVRAKKTQRDKDWPMLRRLVEAHYFQGRDQPTAAQIRFWMLELRSPDLLIEVAQHYRSACERAALRRRLLRHAARGDRPALEAALREEEAREREADRRYWQPLRAELEQLRRQRRR
ncbi:MAG: hypothetical protein HY718_00240 [Planctomycetes bacterium]|nr:hypothetical protein [Planctomycetota bacterium]